VETIKTADQSCVWLSGWRSPTCSSSYQWHCNRGTNERGHFSAHDHSWLACFNQLYTYLIL